MKQVWGLGAAVLSLLLVVLFWTVYVTGRLATTERLAPSETVEGIEVPVIGTVGDFPEPEHRHVVNVTRDGRIVVDGAELSFRTLRDELKRRVTRSRGAEPPGNSGSRLSAESVVLRVDGAVGWGAACALMDACAAATVNRVFFAVRHEGDGAEGAVAVFVPTDVPSEGPGDPSFDQRSVWVAAESGPGTPEALRAHLAVLPESRTSHLLVAFDAAHAVPTDTALAMLDAALRSGAASVECVWGRPPQDEAAFSALAQSRGPISRSCEVVVTDESWTDATNAARHEHHGRHVLAPGTAPPPMPPVARVRGAFAGVTAPRSLVLCD